MAKKESSKISVSALERAAKEQLAEIANIQWCDLTVEVKRSIPLVEMMEFCKEITDACFMDDGTYVPEVMEFAIKSGVLTRYANFRLPSNLEKQYWLIYNTDIYDIMLEYINTAQLNEIVDAANRKLKYLCDSDILMFRSQMTQFIESMNDMQKDTAAMMEGISPDDIQSLLGAIGSGDGLDEEKIARVFIDRIRQEESVNAETSQSNHPVIKFDEALEKEPESFDD